MGLERAERMLGRLTTYAHRLRVRIEAVLPRGILGGPCRDWRISNDDGHPPVGPAQRCSTATLRPDFFSGLLDPRARVRVGKRSRLSAGSVHDSLIAHLRMGPINPPVQRDDGRNWVDNSTVPLHAEARVIRRVNNRKTKMAKKTKNTKRFTAAKKATKKSAAKKSTKTVAARRAPATKASARMAKVAKSAARKSTAQPAMTKVAPKKPVAALTLATKPLATAPKPVMPVAEAPEPFVPPPRFSRPR
jgi:hypothetical protein